MIALGTCVLESSPHMQEPWCVDWRPQADAPEAPKEELCFTCKERPATCAVGKGGITGSVNLCYACWKLDWEDTSDDGRGDV